MKIPYSMFSTAMPASVRSSPRPPKPALPSNGEQDAAQLDTALLSHPAELALIRKLLELEEQIELAVEKLSPHNLTHYALELGRTFSAFYRDCRVVDPQNEQLSAARLVLCRAAQVGLKKTLALLGVSAPESM